MYAGFLSKWKWNLFGTASSLVFFTLQPIHLWGFIFHPYFSLNLISDPLVILLSVLGFLWSVHVHPFQVLGVWTYWHFSFTLSVFFSLVPYFCLITAFLQLYSPRLFCGEGEYLHFFLSFRSAGVFMPFMSTILLSVCQQRGKLRLQERWALWFFSWCHRSLEQLQGRFSSTFVVLGWTLQLEFNNQFWHTLLSVLEQGLRGVGSCSVIDSTLEKSPMQ